jgi:hypothetical protein
MTALGWLAAAAAPVVDDIRDIRGPVVAPPSHPWWPYLVVATATALVILGVRAVVRRHRRRPIPADVRALHQLELARALIERGDPLGFSTAVSDTVRDYVEVAFAVHAPRRTTEELLADLMADRNPVGAHRTELGRFLGFCDLAKYARWSLSREDMTGMVDSAVAFVRATTATPTTPTTPTGPAAPALVGEAGGLS